MLPLRSDVQPIDDLGIRCYLPTSTLTDSDQKEFTANAKYEASLQEQADEWVIFQDVLVKADFTKAFLALMPKLELTGGEAVLELGASHGWASAIIKKQYPGSHVVASDLVADTVRHASRWERLLGCSVDEKWALNCRDLPFASGQFDRIFTFASFHHFAVNGDFGPALAEMIRVLKPGGKIVLLYEPSAPAFLYPFAFARVNKRRAEEGVDEDVIVLSRIKAAVKRLQARCHTELSPSYANRSSIGATVYYYVLSKLGPLRACFVCTANVVIQKSDD